MQLLVNIWAACQHIFLDAAIYILFGLFIAGLIRAFLNPSAVARHLGTGRFASVFKASLLGVPVPL
jgi:uncharacterized membrane protein YraQ (UPF0718 family)